VIAGRQAGLDLLELRGVARRLGGVLALDGIDLRLSPGERLAIVGPSGSGKTTLLRVIAGLDPPTAGNLLLGGKDALGLPPGARGIAMVCQDPALFPHMTVAQNMAFGLSGRGLARAEVRHRVAGTARLLGIGDLLDRLPSRISGGQAQRTALGRAIAAGSRILLLDEPFSGLEPGLRSALRRALLDIHGDRHFAIIHVTHDPAEAMVLGDRLAVMRSGRIEQEGRPTEVLEGPRTAFVAGFLGSPARSIVESGIFGSEQEPAARLGGALVPLPPRTGTIPPGTARILLGLGPRSVRPVAPVPGLPRGLVAGVERTDREVLVRIRLEGARQDEAVVAAVPQGSGPAVGSEVGLAIDPAGIRIFDAGTGLALAP